VLVTLLTVGEIAYVVVLATWIVLEKRSPVATLAWILSLAAVPYLGFILYFLLGPRRLHRKRLRHARARLRVRSETEKRRVASIAEEEDAPLDVRARQLMQLATQAGGALPSPCDELVLFHDAASTYDAIVEAIRAAKHHVHLCYYIFEPGRAGERIRDALIERAKAGVTVRLLMDHVGSSAAGRSFLAPLRSAGAKIAWFNPVRVPKMRHVLNFRNHRKIVVCDGEVGFTGGVNVCDDYVERDGRPPPWRDTHLMMRGSAVRWLQLAFLDDWFFATNYVPREKEYFPEQAKARHIVQVVPSGPDQDWDSIRKLYFAAIAAAQQRVLVTTPYFVPDESMLTALTTAALRGVRVRILVPKRGDSRVVTAAARSYYDELLRHGVHVYEYLPTMLHAKTLVVDGFFAAVGSANMDNRSFRLNFEITVALFGRARIEELAQQFERDLKNAKEVKRQDRARLAFGWKLAEASARLMSPLL
jgi:cardiolipin synthase